MNNTKRTVYNFFYDSLSMVITILLGITIPQLTMIGYGSETNGLLNSVHQLLVYLGLFEAGIQMVAIQSLYQPVSVDDRAKVNAILSAVNKNYKKTGFLYLVALIILALLYPFFIKETDISYIMISCVILFSGLSNVILFLFQGKYKILLQAEGKNYIITNFQTIITIATNVFKIILLLFGVNVVIIVFGTFILSLMQAVFYCMYFKKKYPWIDLSVPPDNSSLSQKNSALIHQVAGMIFQNTDVLILTCFCGLKIVSVYSLYKLIINYIFTLLNIPFNSFGFILGQIFNNDISRFKKMIDVVEVFFASLVFSIYNVVLCLLLPFVSIYTKEVSDIKYADPLLVVMFVAVELLSFIRMPMLKTINYAGKFKDTLLQTILETVINITISLFAVTKFGIYGVLIGTIAALLYRTVDIIFYANKIILDRTPWKTFSIYAVNIVVLFVFQIIFQLCNLSVNSYFEFIFYGIILTVISLFVFTFIPCFIYRAETIEMVNWIKIKLKHKEK